MTVPDATLDERFDDDPLSPRLFNVVDSDDQFIAKGPIADRSIVIQNHGAYPVKAEAPFSGF